MKKINFITNLDINSVQGGWGGINYNIYHQLEKAFDINYVKAINPEHIKSQKVMDKLRRICGLQSNFSFFSDERLALIRKSVEASIKPADYNFFFGQTTWIDYKSNQPYGVYLDADFKTYLNIFSTPDKFVKSDIERIQKKEERWLQNARDIFVGSEWAWMEMLKYYDLKENQKNVVYTGGNIPLPESDLYTSGLDFVFISLNFEKKGGNICVEAFEKIKTKYPEATLTVLGQSPPQDILKIEGIFYGGYLSKTNAQDMVKFNKILSKAFMLIHPTRMDTMGAVLVEAGYFGCPSIAPRSFGVPELVIHNETGIIVEVPFNAEDFVREILYLVTNKDKYNEMRASAWRHTRSNLTWEAVGGAITNKILL